jgi:ribonuclease-3
MSNFPVFGTRKKSSDYDRTLARAIKVMIGKKPINLDLFKLATLHISAAKENDSGVRESNERLEFLGDSVIDLVVAEFLFKKFPLKNEGFLTDIRARIVNRETLNNLARKLGIDNLIQMDNSVKGVSAHKSLLGNTLEAILGAVYLDRGYIFTREFILKKIISTHFDIEEIIKNNPNQKSKIIEWAQKENKTLTFNLVETIERNNRKQFIVTLEIEGQILGTGEGFTKKKAEQDAAQKSCEILNLD